MPDARQKGRRDVCRGMCTWHCCPGPALDWAIPPSSYVLRSKATPPGTLRRSGGSPTFQVFTVGFRFDLQAHPKMVEGRLNLQAGHLAARILGRNSVSKLLCKCIRVAMLECLPSFLHPCPVLFDLIRCCVVCQPQSCLGSSFCFSSSWFSSWLSKCRGATC